MSLSKPFATLADQRIQLRTYLPSDAESVAEAVDESRAELMQWMPWCHVDYRLPQVTQWIGERDIEWNAGREYSFAIIDQTNGQFLGSCSLHSFNAINKFCNVGYWVRSSCTGRGIATSAARLMVQWGFRELQLERIEILAATQNKSSQRVAEKLGATREGSMRRRLRSQKVNLDAVMYSLIPEDWPFKMAKCKTNHLPDANS